MSSNLETNDDGYTYIPTTTQQQVISALQIPPSVLSLIGSSLILYNIRCARRRTPHRRIMFALSACNIFSTMGLIFEPFMVPRRDDDPSSPSSWVFAIGNDASCVVLGAMSQFSIVSQPMYLGFLSLYFLLTVKFGVKQRDFEDKYERLVHGFILILAISTALGGVFLGFFRPNVVSPGCWINPPVSEGCGEDCPERLFAFIFGAVPSIASLLTIVISNILLYVHVRSTVVEGQKKTMSQEMELCDFSTSVAYVSNRTGSETYNNHKDEEMDESKQSADGGTSRDDTMSKSSIISDISFYFKAKGNVLRSLDKQWKRVRQVAHQAFLYVGAFLLTFSWTFAIHYLKSNEYEHRQGSGDVLFPLMILQAIFLPAFGFINSIIFILPKYKRTRQKYDCEPWWYVLEQVLTGEAEKVDRFSSNISMASSRGGGGRRGESRVIKKTNKLPKQNQAPAPSIPLSISLNSMKSVSLSIEENMAEEEQEGVLDPTDDTDLE